MVHGDTKQFDVVAGNIYELELLFSGAVSSSVAIITFFFLNKDGHVFQHPCACYPFSRKYGGYYRYASRRRDDETPIIGPILIPPGCYKLGVGVFDHPKNTQPISCQLSARETALKRRHAAPLLKAGEDQNINFLSLLSGQQVADIDKYFVYDVINHYHATLRQELVVPLVSKFGPRFFFDPNVYSSFFLLKRQLDVLQFFLEEQCSVRGHKGRGGGENSIGEWALPRVEIAAVSEVQDNTIIEIYGTRFVFFLRNSDGSVIDLTDALLGYAAKEVNSFCLKHIGAVKAINFLAAVVRGFLEKEGMDTIPVHVVTDGPKTQLLAELLGVHR